MHTYTHVRTHTHTWHPSIPTQYVIPMEYDKNNKTMQDILKVSLNYFEHVKPGNKEVQEKGTTPKHIHDWILK